MDALQYAVASAVIALGVGLMLGAVAVGEWCRWSEARKRNKEWLP